LQTSSVVGVWFDVLERGHVPGHSLAYDAVRESGLSSLCLWRQRGLVEWIDTRCSKSRYWKGRSTKGSFGVDDDGPQEVK
jgi:hypothetical protein